MGTRADFYVGRGADAEWIGSIAWDGHAGEERTQHVFDSTTEEEFRSRVSELAKDDDFTSPNEGWPWPWNNSHTTDYSYAFDGAQVFASQYGARWLSLSDLRALRATQEDWGKQDEPESDCPDWPETPAAVFPDMSARSNVTFGKRSGILLITA